MVQLRDICLQVRYDGDAKFLVEKFYEPVVRAAVLHKTRFASLSRETLLPIALGLPASQASQGKVQLLIVLSSSALPADSDNNPPVLEEGGLQDELLHKVSEIAPNAQSQQATCPGTFEVKICIPREGRPLATSAHSEVRGFFTDESGESVAYVADWDSASCGSRNERGISVMWPWGDPQFRVQKEITEFDRLWNGEATDLLSFPASETLRRALIAALTYLSEDYPWN